MNKITLEIDTEQAIVLAESLDWSLQATERSLQRNEHNQAARSKWACLDDILAQLQEQKRINWYGEVAAS